MIRVYSTIRLGPLVAWGKQKLELSNEKKLHWDRSRVELESILPKFTYSSKIFVVYYKLSNPFEDSS